MLENEHVPSKEIWSGQDHLSRTVKLYAHERDHITTDHEIMVDNFTAIYDTVQRPDSVYLSGMDEPNTREVFFKRSTEATYGRKMLTKTVVEYNESKTEGFIVTAFPQRKEGGNVGVRTYPADEL